MPIHCQSRICTTFTVFGIVVAALFVGIVAAYMFRDEPNASMIAKLGIGITALIGGLLKFGARQMGYTLSRKSFRSVSFSLLPLTGILLLNALGTPVTALKLTQLDLTNVLVTGFWEETLFRGLLFASWLRIFGFKTGMSRLGFVAVSGIVFGLLHSNGGALLFLRTGLGLMFAMVVLKTHTIAFVIVLHALNNTLVDVLGGSIDESTRVVSFVFLCLVSIIVVLRSVDDNDVVSTSKSSSKSSASSMFTSEWLPP